MLTVSIACYNPNIGMFQKMLQSLKEFTPELSQLIIVDNAAGESDDGSGVCQILKECFPDEGIVKLDIIPMSENVGFGHAHNLALKQCVNPYFAVLNDDIEFHENWSSKMIEALQDETVGQVGISTHQCNSLNVHGQGYYVKTNEPEYVEGSCMMLRTDVAKEFNLFDPAYQFAYFEDSDMSLRLRQAGYKLKAVDVDWIHHRAKTSSKNPVDIAGYHVKNEFTFKQRWNAYLGTKKFKDLMVIKRRGAYGDVFLLDPVIEALVEKYDCAVALMSEVPEMLIHNPNIIATYRYNAPVQCTYFVDLDYAYERDFRKHIVDAYAQLAGVEVKSRRGTVYITEAEQKRIKAILNGKKDFVTVDLSTTWGAKQWPRVRYQELINALKDMGKTVVGIGKSDIYMGDMGLDHNYMNVFSPLETAEVISYADMHIGHEGLLGHFAQALNIKHVILYGCTSPVFVSDTSLETWRGVISEVACQGCRHRFGAGCGVSCKRKYICMSSITTDMVLDKVCSFEEVAAL